MMATTSSTNTLRAWRSIPRQIARAISDLSVRDLSLRGGPDGWSIREYVHHLVEANLVASNIVLAAMGKPGSRYDWSWMFPDRQWMERLGYDRAPIDPALGLLEHLCSHVAAVVRIAPHGLEGHVRLVDSPGSRPRRQAVRQVFEDECEHARHHLRDIAEIKNKAKIPR
jgi:DinB superfamily